MTTAEGHARKQRSRVTTRQQKKMEDDDVRMDDLDTQDGKDENVNGVMASSSPVTTEGHPRTTFVSVAAAAFARESVRRSARINEQSSTPDLGIPTQDNSASSTIVDSLGSSPLSATHNSDVQLQSPSMKYTLSNDGDVHTASSPGKIGFQQQSSLGLQQEIVLLIYGY